MSHTAEPAVTETIDEAVRFIMESGQFELPVLPEVATQLLQLTNDVNCEVSDIVALIKRDQSLTGRLLKIANSTRYSAGQSVSSVHQAVARLGLICIREVVILIACQSRIFDVRGFEADVRRSFAQSLAAAAFAQEIARMRRLNVQEAFLCGLLHDVGRPVLLQSLSNRRKNHGLTADDDVLRGAADSQRIPLAGALVRSWDLPDRLAECIVHQATPLQSAECTQTAAILNLAIDLAALSFDPDVSLAEANFTHPMIEVLNLYPEQVTQILRHRDSIVEWVNSAS